MTRARWSPRLGAVIDGERTTFQVWAPAAASVEVQIDGRGEPRALRRGADGLFSGTFGDVAAGSCYRYRLNGDEAYPDPASRFQPDGVHGPSMVVAPWSFAWTDAGWTGVALTDLIIYELHVGTFSQSGTFAGAMARLPALRDLGITALELMPVAEFPGQRNWGYDGVDLFAPSRAYGTPDDLRRLVDAAHQHGLAVLLDVVYNHLGPDGAYLQHFSPYYFTHRHASPWGAGVNLDGEHSGRVREFFIENALHWIHEYHVDGLRLDATHAIQDDSPRHFLAELTDTVRASAEGRHVHVIAEDDRNLATIVTPAAAGGWGLDAVWADDFHHQARRALAGDADGYFRDYSGTTADLAVTIRQGWFFTGQYSHHQGALRGTDAAGVPPQRFVYCLQNHDQIGNRAFGERLHHQIDGAAYRAMSVLLVMLPQTPLLFMGQEWAATSPFLYFTDHHPELGRLVTEGRRREFGTFAAFAGETARAAIPDPQAVATFEASRLDWAERETDPHAPTLRLYTSLLSFRRAHLAAGSHADAATARALDADTVGVHRRARNGDHVLAIVRLRGAGRVNLEVIAPPARSWTVVLTSEDAAFSAAAAPPALDGSGAAPVVRFSRPAAVILRAPDAEVPPV